MENFKQFAPRIDARRRLTLTRFYTGINGVNSFCYLIHHITKAGTIDKRFKYLFAFGNDDFNAIGEFKSANTGEVIRVFNSAFKSVFGLPINDRADVLRVWNQSN